MSNYSKTVEYDQPFWEEEDVLSPEAQRLHAAMEADQEANFRAILKREERHNAKVARMIKRERVRFSLVRIVRILATPLRVFRASSAEAASRHRQEDDAGGEDDPDDDLPHWRWLLPPLTDNRTSLLLAGGEADE